MPIDTKALIVVVMGAEVPLTFHRDAPVRHVVEVALHESAHVANQEWELRDAEGRLLASDTLVRDISNDQPIYLSPRAGIGG